MQVASNELLLMAKAQNFADLTLGDAVKLLAPMQSPDEPSIGKTSSGGGGGRRPKKNALTEAIKADPLSVVERAWNALNPTEKGIFRSKIANEPPDMMPKT